MQELAKLGYTSPGKIASATPDLVYVDNLLDIALAEGLDTETLDGLAWAIKNHQIDWSNQFWSATYYGRVARFDLVLEKAGLSHLKYQQPSQDDTMIDLVAALSKMLMPPEEQFVMACSLPCPVPEMEIRLSGFSVSWGKIPRRTLIAQCDCWIDVGGPASRDGACNDCDEAEEQRHTENNEGIA